MKIKKRWGKLEVELAPDALERYNCIAVDVFSVAAALRSPEELFRGFAEAGLRALFVLDAWHEAHMPLARRYWKLCEEYRLDCLLSEDKPAEEKAVELACREGCAVLTRDFDAVRKALELNCGAPVLIARRGKVYRVVEAKF
ncbi:MAG: hypothetical protein QXP98_05435 [Thermoproteus sp.]